MSAKYFNLVASAAQTASGNQATPADIKTATMLTVVLNVTAITGTGLSFSFWVETSADGGTTWVRAVADTIYDGAAAADVTNRSNIVNAYSGTTAFVSQATYRSFPGTKMRVRWTISGTTPSYTFQCDASVK